MKMNKIDGGLVPDEEGRSCSLEGKSLPFQSVDAVQFYDISHPQKRISQYVAVADTLDFCIQVQVFESLENFLARLRER